MWYKYTNHIPSWPFSLYPFGALCKPFFSCTPNHRRIETRLAEILIWHWSINRAIKVLIAPRVNKVGHNSVDWIISNKFNWKSNFIISQIARLSISLIFSSENICTSQHKAWKSDDQSDKKILDTNYMLQLQGIKNWSKKIPLALRGTFN